MSRLDRTLVLSVCVPIKANHGVYNVWVFREGGWYTYQIRRADQAGGPDTIGVLGEPSGRTALGALSAALFALAGMSGEVI